MSSIASRQALLAEIDEAYVVLAALIDRTPADTWTSSSVNSANWSLKDVLAHVADWAERCADWCDLGDSATTMAPPAPGFKWTETPRLNHEIYLKRRNHTLARVLKEFHAGHESLRAQAASMPESELITVGRFAWCGPTWSVAKHIRANTAAHYRWATKHFRRAMRDAAPPRTLKSIGKSPRRASRK